MLRKTRPLRSAPLLLMSAATLLLAGCGMGDARQNATPADMGAGADASGPGAGDTGGRAPRGPEAPARFVVHHAATDEVPYGVGLARQDLVKYLGAMGRTVEVVQGAQVPTCEPGVAHVAMLGEGLGEPQFGSKQSEQAFQILEERCGDGEEGAVIQLAGKGQLGRQYAVYEWLHRLGVRFFHPEQEFVPAAPAWPEAPLELKITPDFTYRSVSLHLTHPLELGDAFRLHEEEHLEEGARYIDWQIKNLGSYGHSGVGTGDLSEHGLRRGFPKSEGFALHGVQQGDRPIIEPDDPRSEEAQIEAAIRERMGDPAGDYPELFQFTFNPSEFTTLPAADIIRQLTFITNFITETYPRTKIYATNHGTAQEPLEDYGVRFFDLPQFAPPELGVKIHTLMFYDLLRPAPGIYGNESFRFLFDYMVQEYQTRSLWYYPESSWWLTFDNGVPLYLPITIQARGLDLKAISFMLDGKLDGHRVFGSGHEWGYWQNEYCSFRMAAFLRQGYSWRDCLRDITWPMGPVAGAQVFDVLLSAIDVQERDLIYEVDVLRYLAGTDPETELAAAAGIEFHPLPPTPQAIASWDEARVADWLRRVGPMLERTANDYEALVARLDAVEAEVPAAGQPWFDEIRDGMAINGARARHQLLAYRALVRHRLSRLRFDEGLAQAAQADLEAAREVTAKAIEIVHRREQGYRYQPLSRAIAGGPDGTEDENWTVYGFRVHNRAHHGYYYVRIDEMVEEALRGGGEQVEVVDALLGPEQSLSLKVLDDSLTDVEIDPGDGTAVVQGRELEHRYGAPGVYEVVVRAKDEAGQPVELEVAVAVVSRELSTGFSGKIVEPSAASLIESVMPGLQLGTLDASRLALGFTGREDGAVAPLLWQPLELALGDLQAAFETRPARMVVPIVDRASGAVSTSIVVDAGVLRRGAEDQAPLRLTGELETEAVITAIVSIGGFDERGARSLVASTLGYTPDTLPEKVPFEASFELP